MWRHHFSACFHTHTCEPLRHHRLSSSLLSPAYLQACLRQHTFPVFSVETILRQSLPLAPDITSFSSFTSLLFRASSVKHCSQPQVKATDLFPVNWIQLSLFSPHVVLLFKSNLTVKFSTWKHFHLHSSHFSGCPLSLCFGCFSSTHILKAAGH